MPTAPELTNRMLAWFWPLVVLVGCAFAMAFTALVLVVVAL